MIKPLQPPWGASENRPTLLRSRKCIPPLVAGATTLPGGKHVTGFAGRLQLPYESSSFATPPQAGALWVLSNGAMSLQESIERLILSPGWGGKGTRFVREQSDLRIV